MVHGVAAAPPWLPDAEDAGDLDDWPEAPLEGPEQIIAVIKAEQDRRGIGPSYQGVETDFGKKRFDNILRGQHRTLGEDDWAFLRRYITWSRSQKSAEQLKADYEEANKDRKPDWNNCGAAKKSEVLEQVLKQYVKDDVDVYALSTADREKLANLFTNCNRESIRAFIKRSMNLLPIAGANPRSLEKKLEAARCRRGDEPKMEYRGAILDAMGAVLKTGGADDFNAAREATTLRSRTLEVSRVVAERRDDTIRQLDALREQLLADEESCSEKSTPSLADVAADVIKPHLLARLRQQLDTMPRTNLARLLAFRPPVALTSPRSHKRTDALVRARNCHLRVDDDEDPDEEFAIDTVDSGSESGSENGSGSDSDSGSDDECEDNPSDVLIMKRKGSNHRPWSELPETKAGIDARIADSQRCVALVDVAHYHSFFAEVKKAEVAVDAFDASGTD